MAPTTPPRLSDRQWRLYACACARLLPSALRGSSGEAIELAERFADGQATAHQLASARHGGRFLPGHAAWAVCWPPEENSARMAERAVAWVTGSLPQPVPIAAPQWWLHEVQGPAPPHRKPLEPRWLAHDGGQVVRLTRAIYEGRNWELMPILGDALEEAGCHLPVVLDHCRVEQRHCRGCWLLDAILGHR